MAATDDLSSQRFYHGTRADLKAGDLIEAGRTSNYGKRNKTTYAYLTGTLDAAAWGAELALGEGPGKVYVVEPTGPIRAVRRNRHRGLFVLGCRSQADWERSRCGKGDRVSSKSPDEGVNRDKPRP